MWQDEANWFTLKVTSPQPSLSLSLSPVWLKRIQKDNWKSFQLINAAPVCSRGLHRCLVVTHSASTPNPLAQISLFISLPAVSFSAGPSCILLSSIKRRGRKKTTKGNEGIKGKKMIYIKHNCHHFTFHQDFSWQLLCENGCPTFLISSLLSSLSN